MFERVIFYSKLCQKILSKNKLIMCGNCRNDFAVFYGNNKCPFCGTIQNISIFSFTKGIININLVKEGNLKSVDNIKDKLRRDYALMIR